MSALAPAVIRALMRHIIERAVSTREQFAERHRRLLEKRLRDAREREAGEVR